MKKIFTLALTAFAFYAQAQFTPGNLVVMKITNNNAPLVIGTGTSRAVSLVEYATNGTLVKTVDLPNTGADKFVIEDRRIAHEGQLSLSADTKYITAVGYNNTIGQTATAIRADEKVVIRIDEKGVIDYSTKIPVKQAFGGAAVRAAVSVDGTKHYVASGAPGSAQGVREIAHGTSVTTLVSDKVFRSVGIFGGSFFGVTQDAPVLMEGDGIKLEIPEISGPLTQFVFFDTDPIEGWNGTGLDLLYIANRDSGIRKYYYDGLNWIFVSMYNSPIGGGSGYVALAGRLEDKKPTFYAIKINDATNTSHLLRIQDKKNPKENWNSTGNYPNVAEVATAGSTELFKGVAFGPGKQPIIMTATNDISSKPVELIVKPSVTNDQVTVVLGGNESTKVNILNIQGERVISTQGEGEMTIDVTQLPAGIYFVKTAKGAQGKFVKQ